MQAELSTLNEHAEPPGVWLRRLFLSYASRNTEHSLSALSLQSFRQLLRDLQVASRLDTSTGEVLYHSATRDERRMDYGGFARALASLSIKLYPMAVGPGEAFAALLERDVLPRVGDRAAPPEPVDGSMAASMRLIESLVAPLHSVWLGYCLRPGLSFNPRSRTNRASAVQPQGLVGTSLPEQHPDGPEPDADGDEGMPLESFLHFCQDAGISPTSTPSALSEIFVHSLEGTYNPWVDDGAWQPSLSFRSFQVALLRTATHMWLHRCHLDVRAMAFPRPLKGLLVHALLYTRTRETSTMLSRLRSRSRLGLEHEQLLLDGWKGLLHKVELMWGHDEHRDYYAPEPIVVPSGLEMIGVHPPDSPLQRHAGSSPLRLGASGNSFTLPLEPSALTPQISWPPARTAARPAGTLGAELGADLGFDLANSLAQSHARKQRPLPPSRGHTPLERTPAASPAKSAREGPRAAHFSPPQQLRVSPPPTPRSPGPAPWSALPSSAPQSQVRGAVLVSPSLASGRSLRHGQDGEPSPSWNSPRAATFGTMPWEVGNDWPKAAPPPRERLLDSRPRTTAEAIKSASNGSYVLAKVRQEQLAARHSQRWDFGQIESRLHVTHVGRERRVEQRMRELEGHKLRASSTPRTPKQWIGLDAMHVG